MKKIHLTESQLEYCMRKSVKESADIDMTPGPGETLHDKIAAVKSDPNASAILKNGGKATVDGDSIANGTLKLEGCVKTSKKEINERKYERLRNECCMYTKGMIAGNRMK